MRPDAVGDGRKRPLTIECHVVDPEQLLTSRSPLFRQVEFTEVTSSVAGHELGGRRVEGDAKDGVPSPEDDLRLLRQAISQKNLPIVAANHNAIILRMKGDGVSFAVELYRPM